MRYAKYTWVAINISILLTTLYVFDGKPNSSAEMLLTWGSTTLAFPISLAGALIISTVSYISYQELEVIATASYKSLMLLWLFYFILGYWQWFVIVPMLYRKSALWRSG